MEKTRNTKKLDSIAMRILRFVVFPLIAIILLLTYTYSWIKHVVMWIRWGGELVTFDSDSRNTIAKLLDENREKCLEKRNATTKQTYTTE